MAPTVLIVDDSPVMRRFIRRVMDLAGFAEASYIEASDGAEALTCLHQHHVDLILTDINMPGMDGEELLSRMRSDEALRSIPALVISTDSTRDRMQRLQALGACGYISKPFSPEVLSEALNGLLGANHERSE